MPELPEVETMRRGILDAVGSEIGDVFLLPCARKPISFTPGLRQFRKRVRQQPVVAIDRIGKRVVMVLANDVRVIFEPRMTGLVLTSDPPSQGHLYSF